VAAAILANLVPAMLAGRQALTAENALLRVKLDLSFDAQPFGIVAPEAAQRAAFKKNRRADARPIVNRKPLDVKDHPDNIAHLQPPPLFEMQHL
jgi:hypothetical protein